MIKENANLCFNPMNFFAQKMFRICFWHCKKLPVCVDLWFFPVNYKKGKMWYPENSVFTRLSIVRKNRLFLFTFKIKWLFCNCLMWITLHRSELPSTIFLKYSQCKELPEHKSPDLCFDQFRSGISKSRLLIPRAFRVKWLWKILTFGGSHILEDKCFYALGVF